MAEENKENQTKNKADSNAPENQPTAAANETKRMEIAVLPLQQTTLFPDTVVPLTVGRQRSIQAVENALAGEEKLIACITLKTEGVTGQEAKPADLYEVGTLVTVKRMMRDENGMQLIVQGTERIRVVYWSQSTLR